MIITIIQVYYRKKKHVSYTGKNRRQQYNWIVTCRISRRYLLSSFFYFSFFIFIKRVRYSYALRTRTSRTGRLCRLTFFGHIILCRYLIRFLVGLYVQVYNSHSSVRGQHIPETLIRHMRMWGFLLEHTIRTNCIYYPLSGLRWAMARQYTLGDKKKEKRKSSTI